MVGTMVVRIGLGRLGLHLDLTLISAALDLLRYSLGCAYSSDVGTTEREFPCTGLVGEAYAA